MTGRIVRFSRLVTLIGGSISAVVGILWSLLYINRLTDEARVLADMRDEIGKRMTMIQAARVRVLNSIANQQGDLVFVLAHQGNARQDLAALIYKGNMLDRETPVET